METRGMKRKRKEAEEKESPEGQMLTRSKRKRLIEGGEGNPLSREIEPSLAKKRAKADRVQKSRETSAEIDAERIATAASSSSSKQVEQSGEPSAKEVTPQSVIEQPQVKQDVAQSSTSGSQIDPSSQEASSWPPKPPRLQVPRLNLNLIDPSVTGTEISSVDVPPKPPRLQVPRLNLNLGKSSLVTETGTSSVPGLSQEKQQVPELVETKDVTPEIELPKNLDPENVKAFYKEKVQKYIENQKEFQYISDISIDLEKYAIDKDFAIPPELKQFHDDFEKFSESVQQVQNALESDGVDSEALSKMYGEIIENQRKLESSREKYRTGALEVQMDMNWVDEPGKLAVGGYIREHKALRFAGISVVVDLREKCDDGEALQHHNIELLHRPMIEFEKAASLEFLKAIAEEVNDRLSEGKYVLIHCREGKGRSPQVASCVLAMQGIKDARFQVYDKRPGCSLSQDQSLQTVAFENQYRPKSQEEI